MIWCKRHSCGHLKSCIVSDFFVKSIFKDSSLKITIFSGHDAKLDWNVRNFDNKLAILKVLEIWCHEKKIRKTKNSKSTLKVIPWNWFAKWFCCLVDFTIFLWKKLKNYSDLSPAQHLFFHKTFVKLTFWVTKNDFTKNT